MTNQEKDLQNAREYLEENKEFQLIRNGKIDMFELTELLANHVQHLWQRGTIKFTANRNEPDLQNGLLRCKRCDALNCKNNGSCIECGEPDYQ